MRNSFVAVRWLAVLALAIGMFGVLAPRVSAGEIIGTPGTVQVSKVICETDNADLIDLTDFVTVIASELDDCLNFEAGVGFDITLTNALDTTQFITQTTEDPFGETTFEIATPLNFTITEDFNGATSGTFELAEGASAQVTIINYTALPALGTITVNKTNSDGSDPVGAGFTVYGADPGALPDDPSDNVCLVDDGALLDPQVAEDLDTEDGIAEATTVFESDLFVDGSIFCVVETTVPTGFTQATAQGFVFIAEGAGIADFVNDADVVDDTGSVQINKQFFGPFIDPGSGAAGTACFDFFTDVEGAPGVALEIEQCIDPTTIDEFGAATLVFDGVPVGDYFIVETQTPVGYETAAPAPVSVVVGEDATEVLIENFGIEFNFGVFKRVCEDATLAGTADFFVVAFNPADTPNCFLPAGPVSFTLTNTVTSESVEGDTDADGFVGFQVDSGTFTLSEVFNGVTITSDPFEVNAETFNEATVINYVAPAATATATSTATTVSTAIPTATATATAIATATATATSIVSPGSETPTTGGDVLIRKFFCQEGGPGIEFEVSDPIFVEVAEGGTVVADNCEVGPASFLIFPFGDETMAIEVEVDADGTVLLPGIPATGATLHVLAEVVGGEIVGSVEFAVADGGLTVIEVFNYAAAATATPTGTIAPATEVPATATTAPTLVPATVAPTTAPGVATLAPVATTVPVTALPATGAGFQGTGGYSSVWILAAALATFGFFGMGYGLKRRVARTGR